MQTLKNVIRSTVVLGGQSIQLDIAFTDNTTQSLEIPFALVPQVLQSVHNAAVIAEKTQKAQGFVQPDEFVVPYKPERIRTGQSLDGNFVMITFVTPQGPVQIAMSPDLTRQTIEQLSDRLDHLGMLQVPKPS